MLLTLDRLKDVVHYDPYTGLFIWLRHRSRFARPGTVAGTVSKRGYRCIMVDGHMFKAHRLAWFYMTGAWPPALMDHINGERDDNRFTNLRPATNSDNAANARLSRGNSSGFKGAAFDKSSGRWRAYITQHRKRHHLGMFDTAKAAHAAYVSAAHELFGEFARTE